MTLSDSPAAQVRAACSAAADAAPARVAAPLQRDAAIPWPSPAGTAAQQHGGPWLSSTKAFSTRVGPAALRQFRRAVAPQGAPVRPRDAKGLA